MLPAGSSDSYTTLTCLSQSILVPENLVPKLEEPLFRWWVYGFRYDGKA